MDYYSYLPQEVEEKIATDHLTTFPQLVAFSGVCRSWRSTALDLYHGGRFNYPGLLVSQSSCPLTTCYDHDRGILVTGEQFRRDLNRSRNRDNTAPHSSGPHHQFRPISAIFINSSASLPRPPLRLLSSSHECRTVRTMDLRTNKQEDESVDEWRDESYRPPEAAVDLEKCHCVASKDGWLVLAQPREVHLPLRIFLLNPVTGASILLPSLRPVGYRSCSYHAILSSSPEKDGCHVIILSYEAPQVAWCKVSGGLGYGWEFTSKDLKFFLAVEGACYFGRKLYVVSGMRRCLHVFRFRNEEEEEEEEEESVRSFPFSTAMRASPYRRKRTSYWVMELNAQPIVLIRHCDGDSFTFKVYKLVANVEANKRSCNNNNDDDDDDDSWEEVRSLDGHAAFVGTHQSFCVPVVENNNGIIRRDHVYYLDTSCGQCEVEFYHYDDHEIWQGRRSRDCGVFSLKDRKLVDKSCLDGHCRDYVWFSPMPWDIHKHLKGDKNKARKPKVLRRQFRTTDNDGFQLCASSSMATDHVRLLRQLNTNPVTPCHNRFEALSSGD